VSQPEEIEPIPGLPHALPPGERILWQGRPSWKGLARSPFHLGWLALYLGAVVTSRGVGAFQTSRNVGAAFAAAGTVLPLAVGCLAVVAALALLHARATVYTLTNRRLVMRFGVALPMSFNIPFRKIASADVCLRRGGEGDIVLRLSGPERLAYAHLWPFVRPWTFRRAEPMLRAVPGAARVTALLAEAVAVWSESAGSHPSADAAVTSDPGPHGLEAIASR
jgi:hypothetical protein